MTDAQYIRGLLAIGYRDYIASRVLLNNGNILQGAMLASTAVEKYLKAVLGLSGIRCSFHMDQIGQFKKLFQKSPYTMMFDILDSNFIDLLSKAYRYRYLDEKTVTKKDTIGFLINQFLGTFDFTILKLDSLFIISKESNDGVVKGMDSLLKREWKNGNKDLRLNNYIAEGITKVEFMNRKSDAFGFFVTPDDFGTQIEISGKEIIGLYEDKMWVIKGDFAPKDEH